MPPLPRNKVSKRNRLFHSKPPYPPYPLGLFRPFHLSLRSSSSPLHTSVAAKEVLHALEQLKETHDRHMSKNRSLTKEMVLSLSAELDSICLWIHAFISSFQDIHDDEDGFYRRLLFASTTNISRLLVLEAFRGPPATINQHEPSSDSSFDEGHETYEAHPDGFLFRYISNDPFAAKLREKRDFLSDLFIALEWADACDPGLYHSVLCAIILLYDANAVELFAADNHMFIRLLEQFHELPVTGQLFSHQRLSATIFAALYLGGVVRRTFHDRAYLMQILCRKLRLLSVSLVQNEHLDSCRCSQISIGLAVSFCIRSIPLVAGQGGDSQVTRIAIDEGIIESIDRASILLLDASFWSDHGECQTLSPVVAEAMRHIIHHVAASLSFPRIWQSVLKQLKGVNLTSLETLPMTGTAWAVLRKEADRVVFRSILANICRNPNVSALTFSLVAPSESQFTVYLSTIEMERIHDMRGLSTDAVLF
ncbi:hypothetical protein V5O48_002445 [Marasmius crinis-equi]|uniref:Transcription factor domain-containing protein n=1 Tax=Marasmius crinis-equi TaxID=585013 RepID=A0ABR3FVM3_9AGAR